MSVLRIIFNILNFLLFIHAAYFGLFGIWGLFRKRRVFEAADEMNKAVPVSVWTLQCLISCFFRRNVEWTPIKHDQTISIDDIKNAE